ncbi:hypothetical protein [Gordonia paraffinivorans]|uniref:Secreted protein n=2 Tax=Gordonia paraffinivorans TaxID=175628 RepID=A0ABQ0IQS7_9ACTN|nr:hypothetical protein [Gordonia paraffinivorans]MBY4574081.1 hypothetical protein [Gordonia paraffinivorans]MCD2146023.1 hypothetical protein [Gordonia paraffinivorans]PWD41113.1 hypothetical protein ACN93_20915 [Gordonia paraffinivorans]VFA90276.1 Uncharacterised protein [Gordonia paraffinivorans]GAC85903.1 hypothetical protein GP2_045_00180 [Gordonia paraffinivorans NBRC 108238]
MNTVDIVNTVMVLAEEPQGPEFGKSSPLGLLVILLLLIGTGFLIWSMNRQLKKLPESFDTDHPEPDQAFDEGTDAVAAQSATDDADTGATTDAPTPDGGAERRPADT